MIEKSYRSRLRERSRVEKRSPNSLLLREWSQGKCLYYLVGAETRYYTKPFHLIADKRENFLLSEIEFDSNFYSAGLNSCRLRYFQ